MTNKQKSVNIVDGLQVHNLTNFIKKIYLPFYFDKAWSVEILPTFCTLVKNMQVECSRSGLNIIDYSCSGSSWSHFSK